jgi:hypothetical protein
MKETADLDTALGFVVGRIEAEARRSDEPLSADETLLLHHLPEQAASPQVDALDPEFPTTAIHPRDAAYGKAGCASESRSQDGPATGLVVGTRLGICRCCLETQWASNVLALGLGARAA